MFVRGLFGLLGGAVAGYGYHLLTVNYGSRCACELSPVGPVVVLSLVGALVMATSKK